MLSLAALALPLKTSSCHNRFDQLSQGPAPSPHVPLDPLTASGGCCRSLSMPISNPCMLMGMERFAQQQAAGFSIFTASPLMSCWLPKSPSCCKSTVRLLLAMLVVEGFVRLLHDWVHSLTGPDRRNQSRENLCL